MHSVGRSSWRARRTRSFVERHARSIGPPLGYAHGRSLPLRVRPVQTAPRPYRSGQSVGPPSISSARPRRPGLRWRWPARCSWPAGLGCVREREGAGPDLIRFVTHRFERAADPAVAVSTLDRVRATVAAVPPGQVISYGEIAKVVGLGSRQAGRMVGRIAEEIPWWRVVYADGSPATCHGNTAPLRLAAEGTPFRGGRVNLALLRRR